MMEIWLQYDCLIRETEHGKSVFDAHFREQGLDPAEARNRYKTMHGTLCMPLWLVANIYGKAMSEDGPLVIERKIEVIV